MNAPRRTLPRSNFPHHVEAAYKRILLARVDAFHQLIAGEVIDTLRLRTGVDERARRDSESDDEELLEQVVRLASNKAKDANPIPTDGLVELANRVDRHTTRQLDRQLLAAGVEEIEYSDVQAELLDGFVEANTALIKSLDERYLDDVKEVVRDGVQGGETVDTITTKLEERASVSGSRAKTIARDQVATAGRQMAQARHEELGITEYVWHTAGDERVRPECKANDGKKFEWVEGDGGEHPGDRIMCRCTVEPVVSAEAGYPDKASQMQSILALPSNDHEPSSILDEDVRNIVRRSSSVTSLGEEEVIRVVGDALARVDAAIVTSMKQGMSQEEAAELEVRKLFFSLMSTGQSTTLPIDLKWESKLLGPREGSRLYRAFQAQMGLTKKVPVEPRQQRAIHNALEHFKTLVGQGTLGIERSKVILRIEAAPGSSHRAGVVVLRQDLVRHIGELERVTLHEFGHVLENKNRRALRAAVLFRDGRIKGHKAAKALSPNGTIYPNYPNAGFFDPYMSRKYNQNASTEIISTGLEQFANPDGALTFYRQDPESFAFMIALFEGRFGYA